MNGEGIGVATIRVTVWNEYRHEKESEEISAVMMLPPRPHIVPRVCPWAHGRGAPLLRERPRA